MWVWKMSFYSHVETAMCLHAGLAQTFSVGGRGSESLNASLIRLWGRFPCQEAPAWPPAHQHHLAPTYWRPTAHALALRVGGESKLADLGTDTFWQELVSPHSTEWSADCSAVHKRPEASVASFSGLLRDMRYNFTWNCSCPFNSQCYGLTVCPLYIWSLLSF